jgi:hypothetical protein
MSDICTDIFNKTKKGAYNYIERSSVYVLNYYEKKSPERNKNNQSVKCRILEWTSRYIESHTVRDKNKVIFLGNRCILIKYMSTENVNIAALCIYYVTWYAYMSYRQRLEKLILFICVLNFWWNILIFLSVVFYKRIVAE